MTHFLPQQAFDDLVKTVAIIGRKGGWVVLAISKKNLIYLFLTIGWRVEVSVHLNLAVWNSFEPKFIDFRKFNKSP